MRALRYYSIQDVRVEDIEIPDCKEDEALIKIAYAGICGSDLHIYNKGMFIQNVPETMGHEFDGVIVKVGRRVKHFSVGDKVTANPMVPCGQCKSCEMGSYNTCEALGFIGEVSQGCFTEYIALGEEKLIKMGTETDLRTAALSEPLAVAVHICYRAKFQKEDKLLIIGAGPIGLLTVALAKQVFEVTDITVVDLSEKRLQLARELGAFNTLTNLPEGASFFKVVEAAGAAATFSMAVNHVQANGFIYVVSIFEKDFLFDINTVVSSQITLVGCNVYTQVDLETAVALIGEGRLNIKPVISAEYSLEDGKKAFETLSAANKNDAKILFKI